MALWDGSGMQQMGNEEETSLDDENDSGVGEQVAKRGRHEIAEAPAVTVTLECVAADANREDFDCDAATADAIDFILQFVSEGNVLYDACTFDSDSFPDHLAAVFSCITVETPKPCDFRDLDAATFSHSVLVCHTFLTPNFLHLITHATKSLDTADIQAYIFALTSGTSAVQGPDGDEDVATLVLTPLPSESIHGTWENLVYEPGLKGRLLQYTTTLLTLSKLNIDPRVISFNKVILLHGEPGTGKTSLCKALAQKLTIRLIDAFVDGGILIEVNAHSLFSKWFSESGKLVLKMFDRIRDEASNPDRLVVLLIDEVESLTMSRQSSMRGNEPSDAMRVVNALLTQLDQIKQLPNVLIVTTSNITDSIDLAFVDRVDLKLHIGPPTLLARYDILRSCVLELHKRKLVALASSETPWSWKSLQTMEATGMHISAASRALLDVSRQAEGLSGRLLRKLPLLALAFNNKAPVGRETTLAQFLTALSAAIFDRQH